MIMIFQISHFLFNSKLLAFGSKIQSFHPFSHAMYLLQWNCVKLHGEKSITYASIYQVSKLLPVYCFQSTTVVPMHIDLELNISDIQF